MKKYLSKNENQTKKIAKNLAQKLEGGEVIALFGELGSGKTIFVKGLAKGLGIKKIITSPTFVLMKIYQIGSGMLEVGKGKRKIKYLAHLDCYRIKKAREIVDIGALEFMGRSDTLTVIEWAEKIKKLLPKKAIVIKFQFGKKENERKIEIRTDSK